jgi:hypothetical protein
MRGSTGGLLGTPRRWLGRVSIGCSDRIGASHSDVTMAGPLQGHYADYHVAARLCGASISVTAIGCAIRNRDRVCADWGKRRGAAPIRCGLARWWRRSRTRSEFDSRRRIEQHASPPLAERIGGVVRNIMSVPTAGALVAATTRATSVHGFRHLRGKERYDVCANFAVVLHADC